MSTTQDSKAIVFAPHPLAFVVYYLCEAALVVAGAWSGAWYSVLGVVALVVTELSRRAERFVIDTEGVTREFRFVATGKVFAPYAKIQDISVTQNILDRVFGIGTVGISTAGSSDVEVELSGVKAPYDIERLIRERMKKE